MRGGEERIRYRIVGVHRIVIDIVTGTRLRDVVRISASVRPGGRGVRLPWAGSAMGEAVSTWLAEAASTVPSIRSRLPQVEF